MKTLAIGIDIGGTRTKIGLVDLDSGVVESTLITPTETNDGTRFLHLIGGAIEQCKAKAATGGSRLAGIGMGVPGFVFANGTVDSTYGFLDFMEDYPLANYIQEEHDLPCRLDNDARVVALGEALYGRGRGVGRVLVLTLGTGLGVGFISDGRLDGPQSDRSHLNGILLLTASAMNTLLALTKRLVGQFCS